MPLSNVNNGSSNNNSIFKPLILERKNSYVVENSEDARKVLATRPTGVRGGEGTTTMADIEMVEMADIRGIIFPWTPAYIVFWHATALGAIFTVFSSPFQIAFENEPGVFNDAAGYVDAGLNLLFTIDIFVNFNLAFYKNELIVFERKDIFTEYLGGMFWVDFIGVFPFETAALWWARKACSMYFIARVYNFSENTWLGPKVEAMSGLQRYVTSLYWSIVTFCTVGYGDFSMVNSLEQIVGSVFMLVNVVLAAYVIGSVTLLIVKGDEKTGEYRDSLETLYQYGEMHHFDLPFMQQLQRQLRLEFNNREISDEQVLQNFPSALRRKVLRKLYLQPLVKTELMKGVRPHFVDAFLTSCTVEIFSPGEEIVERGSILSDLFLLVGGIAEITTASHVDESAHLRPRKLETGDFIGEIGFFTESPQVDTVASLTVCKTLTMSRSAYRLLAEDHPGSAGKILQNLLAKVEEMSLMLELPKRLAILRAGSNFDVEGGYGSVSGDISQEALAAGRRQQLTAIEDLVKMHMSKQLDDQTTRLLFAASRGDTRVISVMCDNGFDPNNADYDHRTALMVASMKGNTDVVKMLLDYKANPNLTDMHGSSALLEAVKNGHEATMGLLSRYEAELCMPENMAASILCQAVFDGDVLLLKRLLKAGIDINAADYDKRTAAHIAAAEGNVAAIKVLAEHGADLTLPDRWNNTVQDEAQRSNARQLIAFLKERNQLC